jgi:hypothetical protein
MKYIFCLIAMYVCLTSNCQTTFDVFAYAEPNGWKKETKSGMISYTKINNTKGGYCIISLYACTTGKENLQSSFDSEWKELVVTKLGVSESPQTAKGENLNDWEIMTGSAPFEFNGGKAVAMLMTFTNSGKAASLLVVFNDQGYLADIESFLSGLSLITPETTAENQNIVQQQPTQQQQVSGTGLFSDYVFIPPPGFTTEERANEIILRDASVPMTISILPMQPSSGNLEKDLNTLFFLVFKGWANYANWGPQNYSTYKGTTANGYNYIMEHRDIQQINNSQSGLSATLILVQVHNQVAVFAGGYEEKSATWSDSIEQLKGKYIYLLHSISFKNFIPKPAPIAIIGKWSAQNSSTTASFYDFHTDGTYSWVGINFRKSSYSYTHDKLTTTTREKSGRWSLEGNEITIYDNNTKETTRSKIRIYYENIGGSWTKKLGWLGYYEAGGFGKAGGIAEQPFFPDNR